MSANGILKALEEARRASRGELVEFEMINPGDKVIEVIESNGGVLESQHWHESCHSDTCAHNTHDAGHEDALFSIPAAWQVTGEYPDPAKLFEGVTDQELMLVIPTAEGAVGVFHRDNGRAFAPSAFVASAKQFE